MRPGSIVDCAVASRVILEPVATAFRCIAPSIATRGVLMSGRSVSTGGVRVEQVVTMTSAPVISAQRRRAWRRFRLSFVNSPFTAGSAARNSSTVFVTSTPGNVARSSAGKEA